MASACLPLVFQAVTIDGAPYWDGGYVGNPALFPLFEVKATEDILIVRVNPIERAGAPRSAPDIIARVNEISFNASLLNELRAIDFVGPSRWMKSAPPAGPLPQNPDPQR